jgi:CRISPR-associated protein Csm5
MEKPLKIRLHVLSPIHIGCDDVYEPTNFVIDEQRKKLIEFDPMEFVKNLSPQQRNEFSELCSNENLVSIYKFIDSYKDRVAGIREVNISQALINHYHDALKHNRMNQFILNKTAFNPYDNTPYIPGSSFKGALRTAHLSTLASRRNKPIVKFWETSQKLTSQDLSNPFFTYKQIGKQRLSNLLEKGLLGILNSKEPFSDDPFRLIKVSDLLPSESIKTKIVYAANKSKTDPDRQTQAGKGDLYQMLEVIQPGSIFEGTISGNSIDNLLSNMNAFYRQNNKNELRNAPWLTDCGYKINMDELFLMRLGRHSGAEAVTIEDNRYIKIMQKRGTPEVYLDHATTLWLASEESKPKDNNGLIPFGWAMLEVLPFDVKSGIYSCQRDVIRKEVPDIGGNAPIIPVEQPVIVKEAVMDKDNSLTSRLKLVKNHQTFRDFIGSIKPEEIEELKGISFKGMDSTINLGMVSTLESVEPSGEIIKIIADKILEITTPNKKWDEKKYEKYKKLQLIAGVNNA